MLTAFVLAIGGCGGNTFELGTDLCFNEPDTVEVLDVEIVDGSEPHDLEVYESAELGDQAFDAAEVDTAAFEVCIDTFDGFFGTRYAESELDIYYPIPREASWSDSDREVVCAVYNLSRDQLAGTDENIRRKKLATGSWPLALADRLAPLLRTADDTSRAVSCHRRPSTNGPVT